MLSIFDKMIEKLMHKRLYNLLNEHDILCDLEIRRLYHLFRNRVNGDLKKAKRNYYTKYFEDNSQNIKKTWEGIRLIINIKSTKNL